MLETSVRVARIHLDQADVLRVLSKLSENGWTPAVLDTQRHLLMLANAEGKVQLPLRTFDPMRITVAASSGDLFFKDDDLYYFIAHTSATDMRFRRQEYFIFGNDKVSDAVEIGLISANGSEHNDKLAPFSAAVQEAIQSSLDKRKTRHMEFSWTQLTPGHPLLDKLEMPGEGEIASFVKPNSTEAEDIGADLLAEREVRSLLIQISKAGMIRASDLTTDEPSKERNSKVLIALKKTELLKTEYLLECRKRRQQLTKLTNREDLEKPDIANLICPFCTSLFGDESVSEIYQLSDLAKRLVAQSHWMVVHVTQKLLAHGVPKDAIIWNIAQNGEEVDLLMEFMGRLTIFELKDREFGSGDAHPFNYRQVKYNADKAIIITTDTVSPDAKRVFQDLSKMSARGSRGQPQRTKVVYVEGLDKLDGILRSELSTAVLGYARTRLSLLSHISGIDLTPILNARFGEKQAKQLSTEEI